MKKVILSLILISAILTSCRDAGTTNLRMDGTEKALPEELKGLKIYDVSEGGLGSVKVAVLEGRVVGTTYQEGKYTESVVNIYKNKEKPTRSFLEENILIENDSIIVIRK
jgi:hypothetical protein